MISPRHLFMAMALGGAAWLALWGDGVPEPEAVPAVDRQREPLQAPRPNPVASSPGPSSTGAIERVDPLRTRVAPRPLPDDIDTSSGPFAARTWDPPPVVVPPPPPAAPTAPPLPFTVIGKKVESGRWEVYLAQGDVVHVARPETVIDRTYRVGFIRPPTMSLIYLPLQQEQHLPIGGAE